MPNTASKPTSNNEQTQAPQILQYASSHPQQFEEDTIDLYELWITLWNKKWLVIAATVIAALGSVVYAHRQPPIYKTEALLLPPKAKDIQSLNVKGIQELDTDSVYTTFKNNLSYRSLQRKFIKEHGLLDILAPNRTPETRDIEIQESFANMIKVEFWSKTNTSVTIESNDPDFAAKLINDYISFFDLETIRELSSFARKSIESQIRDIENSISYKREMEMVNSTRQREDQIRELENSISFRREMETKKREDEMKSIKNSIGAAREMAKKQREDKIKLYEEAAVIASKLGFRDGVDTANIMQIDQSNITVNPVPLYYRGFRALRAEIEFLKNRKSDDPFIVGLRDLQQKLAHLRSRETNDPFIFGLRDLQVKLERLRSRKSDDSIISASGKLQEKLTQLRSIKIEEEGQHAVTVDQAAYPPKNRIKPNRRLIVMVGTVAGLCLGIFLAFFVSFVQKQREIHSV